MTRLYVSNKNESVPMFQSRFMEFFSHVHPATPLVIYLPVIAYFLYQALWKRGLSILFVMGLFAFGILIWTLLEYIIHRCVFHYDDDHAGYGVSSPLWDYVFRTTRK